MDAITERNALARHPRVVYRDLADEQGGLLLHLDTGQYHGVNHLGSIIWRLMDGETPVARIAEAVRAQLTEPPAELYEHVVAFLRELRHRDLIVE